MKLRFKHYLHDEMEELEMYEDILEQFENFNMDTEEFAELIGRPFYEVELDCELDTKTGEVKIINAK